MDESTPSPPRGDATSDLGSAHRDDATLTSRRDYPGREDEPSRPRDRAYDRGYDGCDEHNGYKSDEEDDGSHHDVHDENYENRRRLGEFRRQLAATKEDRTVRP